MNEKKIVLAMSGGVDSSVCVDLLQKKGYEVIGVTFVMSEDPQSKGFLDFVNDAKIVAQNFGIKHYVLDLKQEFENKIITYFIDSYLNGLTPNPCVLCNPTVKWKNLIDFADNIGVKKVATGHYAVIKNEDNRYFVSQPADDLKNQTYFLWDLPQEYLERTIFPLSTFIKSEVKELAFNLGLVNQAEKSESYDICFIKNQDYREYLDKKLSERNIVLEPGDFVTEDGTVVGLHNGIAHYTIGQRKGLGIAMGEPYFVKRIDKEKNQIIIAPRENLSSKQFLVRDYSFMKNVDLEEDKVYMTRIRYRDNGNPARFKKQDDLLLVEFENEVFGVTPGQSAVFYDGNDLVGGGVIV
ncbi:MAG: tRNA 2-thiouridine(34) synthase MnmA [Bacteroidales bacterium]|nr:tRNA 2-thiouridine(34) synthase MnmA [Bacteroidales bacterium]